MKEYYKSYNYLQFNLPLCAIVDKFTCLFLNNSLNNKFTKQIKKTLVCLENDELDLAINHVNIARDYYPNNPEIIELTNIIALTRAQKNKITPESYN